MVGVRNHKFTTNNLLIMNRYCKRLWNVVTFACSLSLYFKKLNIADYYSYKFDFLFQARNLSNGIVCELQRGSWFLQGFLNSCLDHTSYEDNHEIFEKFYIQYRHYAKSFYNEVS